MTSLQQPEAEGADSTFLLHGVFAVRDSDDGYALIEVQQGLITVVDVGSITVTSPDGFVKSYPIAGERANELTEAVGSRVTVMVDTEGRTLVEVGDPPVDGADTAALIPLATGQTAHVGSRTDPPVIRTPAALPSFVHDDTDTDPPTA